MAPNHPYDNHYHDDHVFISACEQKLSCWTAFSVLCIPNWRTLLEKKMMIKPLNLMVMAMITTIVTMTIMATMTLTTLKAKQKYVFQESDLLQLYFDTSGQMGRLPPGM